MRTVFLPRRLQALLRWCALLPISCLVGALIGCGSASNSASAGTSTQVNTAPTAKPKFAYTGNQGRSLSGYSVDPSTGALTPLSGFPLAVGANPEYVTHDPQNRFLIMSDIGANMLHVYAINATTGALTEVSPSPYNTMIESEMVVVDPSGTHVYLYRTGGSVFYPGVSGNQIAAFNLSSTGVLSPVSGSPFLTTAPGAVFDSVWGMVIDAAGKFLYLQDRSHLYTFGIDATSGSLTLLQTLPVQFGGGIALDPAGHYLYAAGSETTNPVVYGSLFAYAIDPVSGLLTLAKSSPMAKQSGAFTLSLSPDGNFAYTIEGDEYLVSYTVKDGVFAPVGTSFSGVFGEQIAVDPSGSFVYVPQACSNCPTGVYNVVHQFSIGRTGALTPLATPTVASGVTPWEMTVTSQ